MQIAVMSCGENRCGLLQHFGRDYYRNTVYVNFERMPVIAEYFDGAFQPGRIIRFLEEYFSEKIFPKDTLIIFDEVQTCERALTSLKYFAEEAPEYHIAAAGSLLGVAVHREKYSFPVGKVLMKALYPLQFDEFLDAVGNAHLVRIIREHYENMEAVPEQTHRELLNWLKRYYFVGGMPAVVKKYVEEESLVNIPELQSMILSAYTADMSKYSTPGESTKIQNAFRSLPAQLAKDNRKFQYKLIRKGATAGLFGDSISWLVMAGVAQALKANGHELYYWAVDSPQAEVDFVIGREGNVIPIEVKYESNVHAKSMKQFGNRYTPKQAIRLTARNFGEDGKGMISVPLYAAFLL